MLNKYEENIYELHSSNKKIYPDEERGAIKGLHYNVMRNSNDNSPYSEAMVRNLGFNRYLDKKIKMNTQIVRNHYKQKFKQAYGLDKLNNEELKKLYTWANLNEQDKNSEDKILSKIINELNKNGNLISDLLKQMTKKLYSNELNNITNKGVMDIYKEISMLIEDISNNINNKLTNINKIILSIAKASNLIYGRNNLIYKALINKGQILSFDNIANNLNLIGKGEISSKEKIMLSETSILKASKSILNLIILLKLTETFTEGNKKSITTYLTSIFSTAFGEDLSKISLLLAQNQTKLAKDSLLKILKNNSKNKNIRVTLEGDARPQNQEHYIFRDEKSKPDSFLHDYKLNIDLGKNNTTLSLNLGFSVKTYKSLEPMEEKSIKGSGVAVVGGKPLVSSLVPLFGEEIRARIANFYLGSQARILGEKNEITTNLVGDRMNTYLNSGMGANSYKRLKKSIIISLFPDFIAGSGYGKNLASYLIINGLIFSVYQILEEFYHKISEMDLDSLEKIYKIYIDGKSTGFNNNSSLVYPVYNYAKRRRRELIALSKRKENKWMAIGDDEKIINYFVDEYYSRVDKIAISKAHLDINKML